MTLYAQAHRYVNEMGWSVIPITYPVAGDSYRDGKHPSTPGGEWLAYTKRKPSDDELRAWFACMCGVCLYGPTAPGEICEHDGNARSNIGIVCGAVSGNLVVIDCDDPVTYQALCYVYPEFVSSLTVETGKGFHIYTMASEPVQTTKFSLNGLTHHVKAEGSYVVAPPSLHLSGRTYAFRDPDIAPLTLDPERLRAALRRLGATKAEPMARNEQGWAAELIRAGARKGERDDLTIKLAAYLNRFLPHDTSLAILELWAESRCDASVDDPWGEAEVAQKLRSAARYETAVASGGPEQPAPAIARA